MVKIDNMEAFIKWYAARYGHTLYEDLVQEARICAFKYKDLPHDKLVNKIKNRLAVYYANNAYPVKYSVYGLRKRKEMESSTIGTENVPDVSYEPDLVLEAQETYEELELENKRHTIGFSKRFESLEKREKLRRVQELSSEGLSQNEIAKKLNMASSSVNEYRKLCKYKPVVRKSTKNRLKVKADCINLREQGKSNKEIAKELNIHIRSVSRYINGRKS